MWSDDEDEENELAVEEPPSSQSNMSPGSASPVVNSSGVLVRWLVTFFLLLQAQFRLADRVVHIIFVFLKTFFIVLGRLYTPCECMNDQFPSSLHLAKKMYKRPYHKGFHKFPVCKRCGTVWKYDDCIDGLGLHQKAKLCSYISPFSRERIQCGSVLLKTVELASNKKIFYPLMMYCYIDLHTSLQNLLVEPNFSKHCVHWKNRNSSGTDLHDVYDGRMWKHFVRYNGTSFLDDDSSYAFMLNMDWFQPYKHLTYSVGVIYLSVFNLPRALRYKLQNMSCRHQSWSP